MLFFLALIFLVITGDSAAAHAFGSRYDLPLPLWLYLAAAASAVGFSFIILCLFLNPRQEFEQAPQANILELPYLKWLNSNLFLNSIKLISIFFLFFLFAAANFGSSNPLENFTSIFVWVIWWVGMAFVSALLGNLWVLINPWSNLFRALEVICRKPSYIKVYPKLLAFWPNVFLLFMFAWLELISGQAEQPKVLFSLILIYSLFTWFGMVIYGRQKWLENGEVFHAIFGLLSRFAPIKGDSGQLQIRLPSSGLLTDRPARISEVVFIILLLSTVTFDGILETPFWANFLGFVSENLFLRPMLIWLDSFGIDLIILIKTLALLVIPLLFFGIFFGFCHIISEFGSGQRIPTKDILGYFIFSLVPIAIAYHLSHYLSYLLIAGQQIIPVLSDPFQLGWDLFGTTDYDFDIGIINAKFVWYVAVSSIVIGHIFAVYISHIMAFRIFHDRKAAIQSQYPMMALMIGYTMLSLWILSQPIVE